MPRRLGSLKTKERIALVLDWDDTLFPSTWLLEDVGLVGTSTLEQQLQRMCSSRSEFVQRHMNMFAEKVEDFLSDACSSATVFIITLAREGWVELSIQNFMPSLSKFLDSDRIEILYAEKYGSPDWRNLAQLGLKSDDASDDAVLAGLRLAQVKSEAIFDALTKQKENVPAAEWQSIISIGDSDFERLGVMEASRRYAELAGGYSNEALNKDAPVTRKPWTKSLKMLDDPTVEELFAQLTLIRQWLPHMVQRQDGFDLEIDNSEQDGSLMKLHKQITGLDEILCWQELADMD